MFGKVLNPCLGLLYAYGHNFIDVNGQILKNNRAI